MCAIVIVPCHLARKRCSSGPGTGAECVLRCCGSMTAKALKLKADEVGISSVVYAPKIGIVDPDETRLVEFFLKFLDKN